MAVSGAFRDQENWESVREVVVKAGLRKEEVSEEEETESEEEESEEEPQQVSFFFPCLSIIY
jgi:hypothetical protein